MDSIAIFFGYLTPVFVIYWLLLIGILATAKRVGLSAGSIEFFRYLTKPFFWMNFSYFIVVQAVFTAIYTVGLAISAIPNSIPYLGFFGGLARMVFSFLYKLIPLATGVADPLTAYLFISIVIFLVIMTPYMLVHRKLTGLFKHLAFQSTAKGLKLSEAKFISESPRRLLPISIAALVASSDKKVLTWVSKTRAQQEKNDGEAGDPKKFSLHSANTDHMSWKNGVSWIECWESEIYFRKEIPFRDKEGDLDYRRDEITVFQGLVIRAKSVISDQLTTTVFHTGSEICANTTPSGVKHGFFIALIESFAAKGNEFLTEKDATPAHFSAELPQLGGYEQSAGLPQFAAISDSDLYLFFSLDSEGSLFDFDLKQSTKGNLDRFKSELSFVKEKAKLIPNLVETIEEQLAIKEAA